MMEDQKNWQHTANQLRLKAKLKPMIKDTIVASIMILGVLGIAVLLVPAA